eukprot:5562844-Pyramimonas_sp.AAC.1
MAPGRLASRARAYSRSTLGTRRRQWQRSTRMVTSAPATSCSGWMGPGRSSAATGAPCSNQSEKGGEHMPAARTNRRRAESLFP